VGIFAIIYKRMVLKMVHSFVGTYMEREADALMMENISKNMSDADEYPAMMDMHARCVSIISHLWGVQKGETAIGTATTGSSEAIHLGGLAMKRRWQEKRMAEGKDTSKPNIIMGSNAQVALEKFARYFEVEARILPVSEKSHFRLDPELVKKNIDENTIGTSKYHPMAIICSLLTYCRYLRHLRKYLHRSLRTRRRNLMHS
jgi:glutamate decarboxylase